MVLKKVSARTLNKPNRVRSLEAAVTGAAAPVRTGGGDGHRRHGAGVERWGGCIAFLASGGCGFIRFHPISSDSSLPSSGQSHIHRGAGRAAQLNLCAHHQTAKQCLGLPL